MEVELLPPALLWPPASVGSCLLEFPRKRRARASPAGVCHLWRWEVERATRSPRHADVVSQVWAVPRLPRARPAPLPTARRTNNKFIYSSLPTWGARTHLQRNLTVLAQPPSDAFRRRRRSKSIDRCFCDAHVGHVAVAALRYPSIHSCCRRRPRACVCELHAA